MKVITEILLALLLVACKPYKLENQGKTSDENELEYNLIDKLLQGYKKSMRPAGTVQIRLAINSFQILEIFEKDQIMVINCFIDQKWFDPRLKWGKSDLYTSFPKTKK